MIVEYHHNGNKFWHTEGLINGNAVFIEPVEGIEKTENETWGALLLDLKQVETLRAALDHLSETNEAAAAFHQPFNNALLRLSYLLSTVKIEKR